MPTLNAARYLEECLRSLRDQEYPAELIEVIVADAGSTDGTLELLKRHGVDKVVPNPGITGESARAILNQQASNQLILSIDSDNYLVGKDWLQRMVQPLLDDPRTFASEPVRWDYDRNDAALNRYFALSGVNDPVSLFMGNYGRYSHLTSTWTELKHIEESHDGYFVAELEPGYVPTMGANGYLARAEVVRTSSQGDYYFDIDAVNELVGAGHRRVAKVDVAIGHHFAGDLRALRRKTRRRIEDYLYWRHQRRYPWLSSRRTPIVRFVVYTVLVIPLLWQAFRGWLRVRDAAWLYHVPVCWLTLWLYGKAVIRSVTNPAPHSRQDWRH